MLDVCKCAAARLDITWPAAIAGTTRSRYEGEDTPLGQERGEPTSPCLPRAAGRDGAFMEGLPLQRQEPDSRGLIPRLRGDREPWFAPQTSDGARCCCPPPFQAVSDVFQEPTPALNVRPPTISADREDLQGHSD